MKKLMMAMALLQAAAVDATQKTLSFDGEVCSFHKYANEEIELFEGIDFGFKLPWGSVSYESVAVPISVSVGTLEPSDFGALVEGASFPAGVAGVEGEIKITADAPSGVKSIAVSKLPAGMKFDAKNGNVITGAPTKPGEYTVQVKVTTNSGAVETKDVKIVVAAMPETAVGTFSGFVTNEVSNVGTFTLTATDAGKLTAKVVTAAGTVSFSGTCWDSVEEGVYRATLTTKKGERMSLTLDSNAAWDANQLTGMFTDAGGVTLGLSAQRNAFGKTWYFTAVGDERTGWTFAFTKDAKAAALTVTLKADGSTAIAGMLGSIKVSASGYANVGGMTTGAIIADFAPNVTVNKVKRALSIRTNLWFDRSNAHDDGVGGAKLQE